MFLQYQSEKLSLTVGAGSEPAPTNFKYFWLDFSRFRENFHTVIYFQKHNDPYKLYITCSVIGNFRLHSFAFYVLENKLLFP